MNADFQPEARPQIIGHISSEKLKEIFAHNPDWTERDVRHMPFSMRLYLSCGIVETADQAEARRMDFIRASGECVCEQCGRLYRQHPLDCGEKTYDGLPSLHVLCDLSRVNL
jgi:hypothetical protein